jgi:hypothetical protein
MVEPGADAAGPAPIPHRSLLSLERLSNPLREPMGIPSIHKKWPANMTLDPGNIEVTVGLARVDAVLGGALMTDDYSARFTSAEATLTKALSLAPNHALTHVYLGLVQIFTKRVAQGIAQCERALALDRNLAGAHALIGDGCISPSENRRRSAPAPNKIPRHPAFRP